MLLAATGLSSGNALRFVGLTTFGVDESANVDDLGPPRPAESSEPAGESISAADSTNADSAKAALDFEDADGAGHELWIVSTRNLPGNICSCPAAEFSPGVERFTCGHGWKRSSMEELLATDVPSCTTAILIHGNDTSANEAEARGGEFFRELVTGCCDSAPTRLIVWSWPSDKVICSYRKDAQLKACRTNVEGYYLARFVDQLSAETPVTIGGYSYGARVVTGGLHLLGGGVLEGGQLTERVHPDRRSTSALLMGAAMANNWLLPGMRHDRAISQVDRMMILFNPKDFVLHFYPRLWGGAGPRRWRDGPGGEPPGARAGENSPGEHSTANAPPPRLGLLRRFAGYHVAGPPRAAVAARRRARGGMICSNGACGSAVEKGCSREIPLPVGEGRVRGVANAGRLDNWIAPRQGERDVRPPKRSAKSRRFLRLQLLVVAHQARWLVGAVHVGQGLLGAGVLLDIVILPFDRDRTAEAGAIQLDEERLGNGRVAAPCRP